MICVREQCQFEGEEKYSKEWKIVFFLAGVGTLPLVIGIITAVVPIFCFILAFRPWCPACQKGAMVDVKSPQGQVLRERKDQLRRRAD